MDLPTLHDIFVEQIADIYDAEKQLVKALPKLAKAVKSSALAEAIQSHLIETETHVGRLESVFEALGEQPKSKSCKAMKGLVEEGNETIEEHEQGFARDIAIIAGAQRVEHYEISAYGTARTLADCLGLERVSELLSRTEDEEKNADSRLTEIAISIYGEAMPGGIRKTAASTARAVGIGEFRSVR